MQEERTCGRSEACSGESHSSSFAHWPGPLQGSRDRRRGAAGPALHSGGGRAGPGALASSHRAAGEA
eukprot:1676480-Lingulodinium_polyedra.AAC.1